MGPTAITSSTNRAANLASDEGLGRSSVELGVGQESADVCSTDSNCSPPSAHRLLGHVPSLEEPVEDVEHESR